MSMAIAVAAEAVEQPSASLLQDGLELAYVTETPTGLLFSEDTPQAVWEALTERLVRKAERIHWALADALIFGERKYGETYANAVKLTGMTAATLMNIRSVGLKIDISRRREDVEFWDHREVAYLPPSVADELLEQHVDQGWTRQELRERAKAKKSQLDMEAALAKPAPAPEWVPSNVRIEAADARRLPLDDGCIDLIVTSPPYGVGVAYAEGDVPPDEWEAFTRVWLAEALRVAREGGRLALNVPLDTFRGGERPTYAQAVGAAVEVGWRYRSTVIWMDDQLGKSVARGSVDSASSPYVYAGAEAIALFSNGPWKRPAPCPPDIEHREWLEWTNGIWRLTGETRAWEGHPAPFPAELVRRLVKLLSFPGDAVLDPFCGSGTTPLVASRLGREGLGFDVSEAYVRSALRRATVPGRQSA